MEIKDLLWVNCLEQIWHVRGWFRSSGYCLSTCRGRKREIVSYPPHAWGPLRFMNIETLLADTEEQTNKNQHRISTALGSSLLFGRGGGKIFGPGVQRPVFLSQPCHRHHRRPPNPPGFPLLQMPVAAGWASQRTPATATALTEHPQHYCQRLLKDSCLRHCS